jgi:hypothetical protein
MAIALRVECKATLGTRKAESFSDCKPARLSGTLTTGANSVFRCWIKDDEGRTFASAISTAGLIELDKAMQEWREKRHQAR